MSNITQLIEAQTKAHDLMTRAFVNAKKKGNWNTRGALESRIKALVEKWKEIQDRHQDILNSRTDADKALNYFKEDFLADAEETFIDERGKFYEVLYTLTSPTTTSEINAHGQDAGVVEVLKALTDKITSGSGHLADNHEQGTTHIKRRKLPPIDPPKFSGKYSEWTSFKDKFTALIASNEDLADVERLHYLISCLSGEAANCIKNIAVTDDNYDRAWERLNSHYDNKRTLILSCLDALFNLPNLTLESAQGLKSLKDGTMQAIETLETLKRPVRQWDDLLVYMTVRRLDPRTRRDWETSRDNSTNPHAYAELETFLKTRIKALERVEESKSMSSTGNTVANKKQSTTVTFSKQVKQQPKVHAHNITNAQSSLRCSYCQQSHYIVHCDAFRNLDVKKRSSFVSDNKLCFNCLGLHAVKNCYSPKTCLLCKRKHHTLLHKSTQDSQSTHSTNSAADCQRISSPNFATLQSSNATSDTAPLPASNTGVVSCATQLSYRETRTVVLATARVSLINKSNRKAEIRALVDPCSQASFITESLAKKLNLVRQSIYIPVSGIGAAASQIARSEATACVSPLTESSKQWKLQVLVLPHLTDYQPPMESLSTDLSFVSSLRLADPQFNSHQPVDMIIGVDLFTKIILSGLKKSQDNQIIAQETELGWILSGSSTFRSNPSNSLSSGNSSVTSLQCITENDLPRLVQSFWEQEELPTKSDCLTPAESQCEEHFSSTHYRNQEGRYVLRLPFNSNLSDLGNSFEAARSMLFHMERKFKTDQGLKGLYQAFMDEYIKLGHMKIIERENIAEKESDAFYLPHHGILKLVGDKPKLRVVFNGSVRLRQGHNINECLLPGPKLQTEIIDVLLRWRVFPFVFSADIEKMFRQFLVAADDQKYQRILWRSEPTDPLRIYQLQTVTYGLVSSPYQAIRSVLQLAADEESRFPVASHLLRHHIYVDDILGGHDTLEGAQEIQLELIELLKAGGLRLSKWTANHPSLLHLITPSSHASTSNRTWYLEEHQMLGISWQSAEDVFRFHTKFQSLDGLPTKRKALSLIAKLYDPLGWITPVIILFKIFMQSLWHAGLQWDDLLPKHLQARWLQLNSTLDNLEALSIPRWIGYKSNLQYSEIHGFADASERAYAAVIYLRTVDSDSVVRSRILIAKSKVSPLKQVSLPRLELCGAVLLVKLAKRVQGTLNLGSVDIHLWLDSTVALSWIQGHPTRWKTYVANRVSDIQCSLPQASWHHVKSQENPADLASRGVSVRELCKTSLWFSGPGFLTDSIKPWPSTDNYDPLTDCPEQRSVICVIAKTPPNEWELVRRYSSLTKLLRVTTRCKQFIQQCRRKIAARKLREKFTQIKNRNTSTRKIYQRRTTRPEKKRKLLQIIKKHQRVIRQVSTYQEVGQRTARELTPSQLISSRDFWIRHVQSIYLAEELKALKHGNTISKKSTILRLNPILSTNGLIRVGGRLRHSILQPNEMHPFILPPESYFTKLLIWDAHSRTMHGGTQLTLSFLRQQFWIIRGRQAVKSIIFKCIRCWRQRSQPMTQLMGDLPEARVRPQRPFLHSGVDFAGPINLRLSHGRGARSYKGYIVVFICLATRAVHLEAASDYSAQEFLNVYRRFTARRGICATLSSDCGTNFIGADRELQRLLEQASSKSDEIARLLANDGTEWKFNPPAAPHFGGLWEAAVKSVKFHLKRVIGESTLTFEEMSTLLAQIEACLNSRPIQPLHDDPTSLEALTPAHFLIGCSLTIIPEPSILDISAPPRTRWQMIRQMQETFWTRWSNEYLHELQHRPKWQRRQESVRVGALCILRTNLSPPCKWPLARIIEVMPGSDGLVRVVKLRTASTTFTRPISKISILPSQDQSSP